MKTLVLYQVYMYVRKRYINDTSSFNTLLGFIQRLVRNGIEAHVRTLFFYCIYALIAERNVLFFLKLALIT